LSEELSRVNPSEQIVVPLDSDVVIRLTVFSSRENVPLDVLLSFNGVLRLSNRKASFVASTTPKTLEYTVRVPQRCCFIPYLGKVTIMIEGENHCNSELNPVRVVTESDYFEYIVRDELRALDFVAERYGGKDPDVVAYHNLFPEERFDVECTLESPFDMGKFNHDFGKYMREKTKWGFTRLLLVSHSTYIMPDIPRKITEIKDTPISLVTFVDLRRLKGLFREGALQKKDIYLELIRRGLIQVHKGIASSEFIEQRILNIPFKVS
jgi:hypothetical protein